MPFWPRLKNQQSSKGYWNFKDQPADYSNFSQTSELQKGLSILQPIRIQAMLSS